MVYQMETGLTSIRNGCSFESAAVGYLDLVRSVNRALEHSVPPRPPLWPSEDVRNLESLFRGAEAADERLIRVGVVGEVNAGKSTLVNALVEAVIVPTDILEMTSWVTHIQPTSDREFFILEMADGTAEQWEASAFFEKCQSREVSSGFIRQIRRVLFGCNTRLPFVLVDTPGLGSITRENESLLMQTIRELDVVIWTVECSSLGSLRDVTLVKAIRATGLPVWCVITQCDQLASKDELVEVMDWLTDQPGLGVSRVFAVSALCAVDSGTPLGRALDNDGVTALKTALVGEVRGRDVAIRSEARRARQKAFCRESLRLGEGVLDQLEAAKRVMDGFRPTMSRLADSVSRASENYVKDEVRQHLFSDYRDQLVIDLRGVSKGSLKALSSDPDLLRKTVLNRVPPQHVSGFWADIQGRLAEQIQAQWADHLTSQSEEIAGLANAFAWDTENELAAAFNPISVVASIEDRSDAVFNTVLGAGVATAVGATAWAAWFGASAAAVSFGAAATGIGIPIAAVGAGIAIACRTVARRKARAHFEDLIDSYLVDMREVFITEVLEKQVFPELRRANERLASDMVERLAVGLKAYFPRAQLDSTVTALRMSLEDLSAAATL